MTTEQQNSEQTKQGRKPRARSVYLFPAYDLAAALQIAQRVAQDGGGTLTEDTLAFALGVSVKSSGFRLKGLTARQFGLLTKQGEKLVTTPLAEAIFRPTNEQEPIDARKDAFLRIPLFSAVATRFKGQPLPEDEVFRNILQREFKVEGSRVRDAHRVLIDSAREAGILHRSGSNTYLRIDRPPGVPGVETGGQPATISPPPSISPPYPSGATQLDDRSRDYLLTISEEDLAQFEDKEFDEVWQVLGKVLKARSRRNRQPAEEQAASQETDEDEEET